MGGQIVVTHSADSNTGSLPRRCVLLHARSCSHAALMYVVLTAPLSCIDKESFSH